MDSSVLINIASMVIAALSLVVAVISAGVASRTNARMDDTNQLAADANVLAAQANDAASEANALASEANAFAREANEISQEALEHQKLHAPPPWSEAILITGSKYEVRNTSGRTAIVVSVEAIPEEAQFVLRGWGLPSEVENGDRWSFFASSTMDCRIAAVTFHWHFVDEPDNIQVTRRNL